MSLTGVSWEELAWLASVPATPLSVEARAEVVRRTGSDAAADRALRERAHLSPILPIGLASEWCPECACEAETGIYELRTATRSLYRVRKDGDGSWWLAGENRPSIDSAALPEGWWRILRPCPWPPSLGVGIVLIADPDLPFDSPDRLPGGGKITSPIRSFGEPIPA